MSDASILCPPVSRFVSGMYMSLPSSENVLDVHVDNRIKDVKKIVENMDKAKRLFPRPREKKKRPILALQGKRQVVLFASK